MYKLYTMDSSTNEEKLIAILELLQKQEKDIDKLKRDNKKLLEKIEIINKNSEKMANHIDFINRSYDKLANSYIFKNIF